MKVRFELEIEEAVLLATISLAGLIVVRILS